MFLFIRADLALTCYLDIVFWASVFPNSVPRTYFRVIRTIEQPSCAAEDCHQEQGSSYQLSKLAARRLWQLCSVSVLAWLPLNHELCLFSTWSDRVHLLAEHWDDMSSVLANTDCYNARNTDRKFYVAYFRTEPSYENQVRDKYSEWCYLASVLDVPMHSGFLYTISQAKFFGKFFGRRDRPCMQFVRAPSFFVMCWTSKLMLTLSEMEKQIAFFLLVIWKSTRRNMTFRLELLRISIRDVTIARLAQMFKLQGHRRKAVFSSIIQRCCTVCIRFVNFIEGRMRQYGRRRLVLFQNS